MDNMIVTVSDSKGEMCYGCTDRPYKKMFTIRSKNNMRGSVVNYCSSCIVDILMQLIELVLEK